MRCAWNPPSRSRKRLKADSLYALPGYAKTIQRGVPIFASNGELPRIAHVAAENADGSRVLVMTNTDSREQRAQCTLASRALNLVLPPDSITSLVWS
jgi:glucosylceramidase